MPRSLSSTLVAHAIAHGVAACALVGVVALLWTWLPAERDSALALATVGWIGGLAWGGATLLARKTPRSSPAANDNAPPVPIAPTWATLTDRQLDAQRDSR